MIESIFETPLYVNAAEDQKLKDIQSEIANSIDSIDLQYNKDWGKTHKVSKLLDNIIEKYKLVNLERFLHQNLYEYLDVLNYQGNRKYKIKSWVSLFELNDYGHIHDHGSADISGVYYFQTNKVDGDLVFYNPIDFKVAQFPVMSDLMWRHPPIVGKILMFPGYLRHGILRNETPDTRISISFNISFKKV